MTLLPATASAAAEGSDAAVSETVSLRSVADSYVASDAAWRNHGRGVMLNVDGSPRALTFVKFDLSPYAGRTVTRATLKLHATTSGSSGKQNIKLVTDDSWTESGVTYNNRPAVTSTLLGSIGPTTINTSYEVPLAVAGVNGQTGGQLSLGLDSSSTNGVDLASREAGTTGPTLVLELEGAPAGPVATTPAPPSTPPTAPDPTSGPTTPAALTWAPPTLSSPVTYRIKAGSGPGQLNVPAGQDSVVIFEGAINRRLIMNGGRHWIVRGAEVNNNRAWPSKDDQSALQFMNVKGTAFVEGLYAHGAYGTDGIRLGSGSSGTTLIVQNSLIRDRLAGSGVYHADFIQAYGGVKEIRIDRMTGHGDFQGFMWKQEPGTVHGPTDFRRVNFVAKRRQIGFLVHITTRSPVTGAIKFQDMYADNDPAFQGGDVRRQHTPSDQTVLGTDELGRKFITYKSGTPVPVSGRVTQGRPPGGDFVTADAVGIGYVSPGYL